MDYCHPCRRHLNGALACPGCGAPVLTAVTPVATVPAGTAADPYGQSTPAAPYGQDAPAAPEQPKVPRQADRRGAYEPPTESTAPEDTAPEDASDTPDPAFDGSRRDRKAAAHRRRRRRTLLVVTGFVLAAGALSLAELGTDAPFSFDRPASSDASPDGGAASASPDPTGAPLTDASPGASSTGSPSASPSDSPSASPSESASETASETPSSAPTTERPAATTPRNTAQAPADPAPAKPTPTPTTAPTTSNPTPTPTPTKTCDRFLWWCA
ncbi:SCO2400 family protein [Streptomyces sp. NPDC004673]